MASENRGFRRVFLAARYSWQGLATAYRKEEAFRQELWLALVLVPLGLWLGDNGIERALLVGSVLLVLIVELLNTGIENVVDRVGLEPHKLSGRAKDMGSAAVFVALANVALVWGLVLFGG
ncbi:MAG: diacylglycerol kinase [Halothiobacillaceae bacterium]|jgi:diacylglycerol kinase (ATP)|nr:diacylglycerol kinase [Halothiobacillaceae bacterium]MDY0049467.1 diacylglycerol kinase [Halothiobacillaceae bacterium]